MHFLDYHPGVLCWEPSGTSILREQRLSDAVATTEELDIILMGKFFHLDVLHHPRGHQSRTSVASVSGVPGVYWSFQIRTGSVQYPESRNFRGPGSWKLRSTNLEASKAMNPETFGIHLLWRL